MCHEGHQAVKLAFGDLVVFSQKTTNSAVYVVVSMHMKYRVQLSVISSSLCNRSWPHNIVSGGEAGRNRSHFITLPHPRIMCPHMSSSLSELTLL